MNWKTELKKLWYPTHTKVKLTQWICHLAIIPAIMYGSWPLWIACFVMCLLVHGLGSGIGAHRYFTHHSFKTNKFWEFVMAFFFTIACSGSLLGYILIHEKHHSRPDREGDPHNPNENGFVKTWLGFFNKQNLNFSPRRYKQLFDKPIFKFFHKYYFLIISIYALGLFAINPLFPLFFLCLPSVYQFHANSALIVLTHSGNLGSRNFETNDDSRNIWWLKPLLLGEELHNNHHRYPANVTMRATNSWKEFDPLYYIINLIRID